MNTKLFPACGQAAVILVLTVLLIWPAQVLAVDANSTAAKDVNSAGAAELKPIQLPKPQMDGGKPLMQALKERKSSRIQH